MGTPGAMANADGGGGDGRVPGLGMLPIPIPIPTPTPMPCSGSHVVIEGRPRCGSPLNSKGAADGGELRYGA